MDTSPHSEAAYRLMHHGILAIARAEQQGIRVDMEYLEQRKANLTSKINRLERKFKDTDFYRHWEHSRGGRVNINSNAQLAHFLYKTKKLEVEKETESGQGSTDEETLRQLNIPELDILLDMRKLKKVRDTYLEAFSREQVKGYIHPFFNLHLVRTFRSSSDHPNFQNIPKRDEESMQIVRKALYPRPGHQLMEVDYSQLEVRIAACYNHDQQLIYDITQGDMHRDMAVQIFMLDSFDKSNPAHKVLRQAAKNGFVFPEFYGDYYKNCATYMACNWGKLPPTKWKPGQGIEIDGAHLSDHFIEKGIKSLDAFINHVKKIESDFWGVRFADYAAWKDRWWKTYQKYGYIDMYTGFRCHGVMGKNDCINYPVQGAAFHCLLWAFTEIDRISQEENWRTRLVGQIHDSMILDVHPDELEYVVKVVHRVTCEDLPAHWPWIIVPLEVEIELCPVDGSWAEKAEYKIK